MKVKIHPVRWWRDDATRFCVGRPPASPFVESPVKVMLPAMRVIGELKIFTELKAGT